MHGERHHESCSFSSCKASMIVLAVLSIWSKQVLNHFLILSSVDIDRFSNCSGKLESGCGKIVARMSFVVSQKLSKHNLTPDNCCGAYMEEITSSDPANRRVESVASLSNDKLSS